MSKNQNHKIVKVTSCSDKLKFAKAFMDNTSKPFLECRNIVDMLCMNGKPFGVILLNESLCAVEQWEAIAQQAGDIINWEYINE